MTIGIDFDNTLVNTIEVTKKYLDMYMPNNSLKSYHDLSEEEELKFFMKYFKEITSELSIFPFVKEAFDYFKKNDIKTVLITARGSDYPQIIEPTEEFLEKNNLVFDKKVYSAKTKGQEAKENNIDLMIDDNIYVLDDVSSKGIKVLKFGGYSDKYKTVKSWQEILEYVKKIMEAK